MRLLLIRHGQTSSNVGHNLDTSAPGAELSEMGLRQAAAIPQALADEPLDAIYCSNLTRAQQTAQPLAASRGLPVQVRDGVREISAGDLEMRSDLEAITTYVTVVFGWAADPTGRLDGGETCAEVLQRFDAVVDEARDAGHDQVAIVSHGAMLRVWISARAANVDAEFAQEHWLANTAMVVLEEAPQASATSPEWRMLSWGEHALGGPELDNLAGVGPAGEPEELNDGD